MGTLGNGRGITLRGDGVGVIGRNEFGVVLCGCGCVFILVNLEACNHMIHIGVSVVEAQFTNCSSSFSEFKVIFTEVVFKIVTCFVRLVGAFPCRDVFFDDLLTVEDNKGKVYWLTLS